jgi:hypothetical protein
VNVDYRDPAAVLARYRARKPHPAPTRRRTCGVDGCPCHEPRCDGVWITADDGPVRRCPACARSRDDAQAVTAATLPELARAG